MQITGRHILVAGLSIAGLWTARSFVLPIVWGVILAVALWPLYRRWIGDVPRIRPPVLVPLGFTLATGLIVILPLTLAVFEAARDSQAVLDWIERAQETGVPPPQWLEGIPVFGHRALRWWLANLNDPADAGSAVSRFIMGSAANWTIAIGADIARRSFTLLIDLVVLFILLRHGHALGTQALAGARRMLGRFGEKFLRRLADAVRGTVAFAMLPFGAWVMFTAAAAILVINGSILAALLLFGWGATVMLIGDNIVEPALIGGAARLPFFWALVGTFGGLEAFGLIGIFVGPVIMVALLVAWEELLGHTAPAIDGAS